MESVGADLHRADLTRAELKGTDLTGADLSRADLSRAESVIGYRPRVSFSEGLRRTYEWYRQH